jgi:hypothetical protein
MPHTENKFQTIDKRRRSALAELAALVQLGYTRVHVCSWQDPSR